MQRRYVHHIYFYLQFVLVQKCMLDSRHLSYLRFKAIHHKQVKQLVLIRYLVCGVYRERDANT